MQSEGGVLAQGGGEASARWRGAG